MELNNVISPTVVSDNSVAGQDYVNFTMDSAGNIVSYNVAFEQELGYGAVKESIYHYRQLLLPAITSA